MGIFLQIAIAVTAATVIFGVIWMIYGSLRTPVRCGEKASVCTMISVRENAEGLEQTLRGLVWLQENGTLLGRIVIVDCGMDDEGRALTRLAVKKYGNIVICQAEEVREWIEKLP